MDYISVGQDKLNENQAVRREKSNKTYTEPHYYSEKLKQKLETIRMSAATVVDAPSGYGKTTAIRDFLESSIPKGTPVYWFTAADEDPNAAFKRLCREIERIDCCAGGRLLKIELPGSATVGEACDALRCLRCENETYLVIDNFQFMIDILPFSFISSLFVHGGKELHIIVITQILRRNILAFMEAHGVAHITEAELRFSSDDIRSYYEAAGVPVSQKDAVHIEHNTGGWVAAIYLHLRALREGGMILDTSGILALTEHLVWDTLSETQQTFLLRLSPFETVTIQQACILCGYDTLPDYAREALQSPFIRFEPSERRYELHSILSDLLRKKRRERGAAFDRECLLYAGDLCRGEGMPVRAMGFYAQAGDYGRILSLDISTFYFETIGTIPFYELALEIAQHCTPELMQDYPLSMLRIAYSLLTAGMDAEFYALLDRLLPILDSKSGDEGKYLLADWTLLSSYRHFPSIPEMTAVLKQAAALFRNRHSRVIRPDSPWCYGIYSPLSTFHSIPGQTEQEAKALEEYFTLYTRLTGGHGSGADVLFKAELAHYRCDLNEAEILAYKAAFTAQSKKQNIIQLAATFHLAEIVLKNGDSAGWRNTSNFIMQSSPGVFQSSFVLPSTLDTLRGIMLSDLGISDDSAADWLKEGDFSGRQLADMESHRMMMHLDILNAQKKFARLIGTVEAAYPECIKVKRFADVNLALIAAVGYFNFGKHGAAAELIRRAAALTLPDGILIQLIYYNQLLGGMVEECIAREYPTLRSRFGEAVKRYRACLASVYADFSLNEPPESLTHREHEVAMLAIEGLNNNEIAERLYLTESTVRTHLRAIFRKLNIDRRAKLAGKLR